MPPSSFNIHAAKSNLSRLVMRAEKGERITIARAGRPVAQLGPAAQSERPPLSPDDPLLNLDRFAADGPGGKMTNKDIDHLLYGRA
ncbi:MAG: type II toxin-antitoxin system prevent-host-death family antitoxin [Opitutaceae bacterium]|jgi:prevent-host-death family protein